jgi:hypothetical protein
LHYFLIEIKINIVAMPSFFVLFLIKRRKNMKRIALNTVLIILSLVLFVFESYEASDANKDKMMKISSPSFVHNGPIPKKYTCQGENISPELRFEGVPENAKSLILIVDDPDAPGKTWVHWFLFNISPETKGLKENADIAAFGKGVTDFGKTVYGGPCPPQGYGSHRYFFKLYALDTRLDLADGASKKQVEDAMEGHIIAQAELIGLYERK